MDTQQLLLQNIQQAYSVFMTLILGFIPRLIAALIVGGVGLILASGLSVAVKRLLDASRLDVFLKKLGLEKVAAQFRLSLDTGAFLAGVVEWVIIAITLLAVFDVFGLSSLNALLMQVFEYLPNVIIAAIIIVASIVIARLSASFVGHLLSGTKVGGHTVAVSITKIGVVGFGVLLALDQLGVASDFIRILFAGFVFMVSLAGGLAFGLGGRDVARETLEDVRQELARH